MWWLFLNWSIILMRIVYYLLYEMNIRHWAVKIYKFHSISDCNSFDSFFSVYVCACGAISFYSVVHRYNSTNNAATFRLKTSIHCTFQNGVKLQLDTWRNWCYHCLSWWILRFKPESLHKSVSRNCDPGYHKMEQRNQRQKGARSWQIPVKCVGIFVE